MSQKCMEVNASERPSAESLWQQVEKFEQNVQAWNTLY